MFDIYLSIQIKNGQTRRFTANQKISNQIKKSWCHFKKNLPKNGLQWIRATAKTGYTRWQWDPIHWLVQGVRVLVPAKWIMKTPRKNKQHEGECVGYILQTIVNVMRLRIP
jgi:hypothetical protein